MADALTEIQEQVMDDDDDEEEVCINHFSVLQSSTAIWLFTLISWQDGDLEDGGTDQDLLYSATSASHTRPTYEYLNAMAKAFEEVLPIGYLYLNSSIL